MAAQLIPIQAPGTDHAYGPQYKMSIARSGQPSKQDSMPGTDHAYGPQAMMLAVRQGG
jgi:hypothetical protein